ncbi:hypothetical protein WG908_16260 [Sphingobium sp. AN641]|uniref:hypothetical protein n=1 Tax=Sphingobium sp. AN641 TaxID=3133443 RepID=UPI0030BCFC85
MVSQSDYVMMAAESYFYYRRNGEQPIASYWDLIATIQDDNLEALSVTVFQNNDQYVIAFRGTDNWELDGTDALQNFLVGVPLITGPQTVHAINAVQQFMDSHPDVTIDQISFTGHSLARPSSKSSKCGGSGLRRFGTVKPRYRRHERPRRNRRAQVASWRSRRRKRECAF